MGFDKTTRDLVARYSHIKEQSVPVMDPSHFDYSDPYWQTPEGKAERADRDQRYNASSQRQQQVSSLPPDQATYASPPGPGETNQELKFLYKKVENAAQSGNRATYDQAGREYQQKYNELYPTDSIGKLKKDIGGLFNNQPATVNNQTSQPVKPTTQQTEQPITPTRVNYNNSGFDTSSIDKAAQAAMQQNPNFNADMISQQFKNNIKQNIDTLANIGMSEAEIQKRIAPAIKSLADQIPKYVNTPNYQRQDTQQNATGRTPQQVYGMPQNQQYKSPFNPQGQRYNPPQQTVSQAYQPQAQQTTRSVTGVTPGSPLSPSGSSSSQQTPWYKKPYNQKITATKSY